MKRTALSELSDFRIGVRDAMTKPSMSKETFYRKLRDRSTFLARVFAEIVESKTFYYIYRRWKE